MCVPRRAAGAGVAGHGPREAERQAFALRTMTEARAGAGRVEEAVAPLDRTVELARTITDPEQQVSTIGSGCQEERSYGRRAIAACCSALFR
ncbi:hypothetical protein [Streptomyces sp. NPDC050388]|uniref:hypothetical protein n=1 Tax=Streptomyces sp. NPDC050388 TaxID=3155781 RepID=UPI00343F050D